MKYRYFYIIISLLVLIPGVVSLFVYKLNLAIDFTGGSVFKFELKDEIDDSAAVEVAFREIYGAAGVNVESFTIEEDTTTVTLRSQAVDSAKNTELKAKINEKYAGTTQTAFESIGPSIGTETTKKSLLALFIASLGILFYIAFAFRNIPQPYSSFKFGISAILAMLHDAFVVLGIFSILGHFLKIQIDALFITAILTIIGFSVHDTIVVFDRIRENLKKLPSNWKFREIVNYSVVETLNRSFATSLTVIITLLALFLLGGESIRYFVLALLIGIISGTYSSIFTAAPILVIWEEFKGFRFKRK